LALRGGPYDEDGTPPCAARRSVKRVEKNVFVIQEGEAALKTKRERGGGEIDAGELQKLAHGTSMKTTVCVKSGAAPVGTVLKKKWAQKK